MVDLSVSGGNLVMCVHGADRLRHELFETGDGDSGWPRVGGVCWRSLGCPCMKRVLVSWSSGKDSAWTLHILRQTGDCDIVGLLTTLNSEFDRVAMHGTRRSVLEAQAKAAELPLWTVPLPWPCPNGVYEHP
jgi:hypothetical protein